MIVYCGIELQARQAGRRDGKRIEHTGAPIDIQCVDTRSSDAGGANMPRGRAACRTGHVCVAHPHDIAIFDIGDVPASNCWRFIRQAAGIHAGLLCAMFSQRNGLVFSLFACM